MPENRGQQFKSSDLPNLEGGDTYVVFITPRISGEERRRWSH